jgi:hypothetical protein
MTPDILMADDLSEKVKEMIDYWLENKIALLEKHRKH